MELMRRDQGAATPDAATPSTMDAETPPMAAPMATPEPKQGNKEAALINLGMAMDLIEQSLPNLGSETAEGQAAIAAIRSLTKVMGERKPKADELQRAEILQMLQALPQAGGASPEARAMAQAPVPGMTPPAPPAAAPGAGPVPGGMPTPEM